MRWLLAGASIAILACGDHAASSPEPLPSQQIVVRDAETSAPLVPSTPAPSKPSDVTLQLAPVCSPGSSEPSALAIALSLPATHRLVFRLDDDVMGTSGVTDLITDATASDDRGALPIVRRVRDHTLELAPSRATNGTVTLRYLAHGVPASGSGAVEGVRYDETGIGGHGRHFLVLPDSRPRYRMRIEWSPAQCPSTTLGRGFSTFGDVVGDVGSLREAVYYWGHPQESNVDDGTLHVRSAWFGAPAFDVARAGSWAAKVFASERAFFGDDDPAPYSVFVRVLQSHGDRANGIAQETSYLAWIGPQTHFARRLEVNIAHEILHRWIGVRLRLAGAEGSAYWFTEGFTTHFSNVIAFRSGLLSIDEFLESLNDIATRHFDDKLSTATNDELLRVTRRDQNPPIVPYTRGALYAAELDGALRSISRGKRTLDEVVRELYRQARTTGGELPADAIRTLVRKELGQPGVDRYDTVIVQGHDPNPPSDAYGPCFARKPRVPKGFTWVRVIGVPDAQCRRW